jgi:DNA-binding NtrC family response regulator
MAKVFQVESIDQEEFFSKMKELLKQMVDDRLKEVNHKTKQKHIQEEVLTRQEAADFLKINIRSLDNRLRDGKIKFVKDERFVAIKKSELIKYINNYEQ